MKRIPSKWCVPVILGMAATFCAFVHAEPGNEDIRHYRVSAQFYHLGELIAAPVLVVEEDQVATVTAGSGGQHRYRYAVRVRSATRDQVQVSVQFDSGALSVQPELLVKLGELAHRTVKPMRMTLLVEATDVTLPEVEAAESQSIESR